MLKKLSALLMLVSISALAIAGWTPCGQGNDPAVLVETGEEVMCCSLGEDAQGTLLSCTDGARWFHARPVN